MSWLRNAVLLAASLMAFAVSDAFAGGPNQNHRGLKTFFTIQIDEGTDAPLAAGGTLVAAIAADGGFVGALLPRDFFDEVLPSVVFRGKDAAPDPAYAAGAAVAGQINGRAFNLVVDLGAGGRIFGSGTATANLDHLNVDKGSFQIGGIAVGPGAHDKGDWRAAPIQPPTNENCIVPFNHCNALCSPLNASYFGCEIACQAQLASCEAPGGGR